MDLPVSLHSPPPPTSPLHAGHSTPFHPVHLLPHHQPTYTRYLGDSRPSRWIIKPKSFQSAEHQRASPREYSVLLTMPGLTAQLCPATTQLSSSTLRIGRLRSRTLVPCTELG